MQSRSRTIAAAVIATVFAGCSGGGGAKVVPAAAAPALQQPPTTSSGSAKVALTLRLPGRGRAVASVKRPRYVTGAIDGLAVRSAAQGGTIGQAAWQLFDLSPSSPLCATQPDGSRQCTLAVYAPIAASGKDEFQVASYDATPAAGATTPAGNAISAVDVIEPIAVGTANALSIQLDPVVASVTTDKPRYVTWAAAGQSSNVALNLTAADADGALITADTPTAAPFASPIAYTDTLAPSPFTYSAVTTPGASSTVPATVKYTAPAAGTAPPASATIALHGGAPAWVVGANGSGGSFTIVPMILAGNAANVAVAPNGPPVPLTIAESGATGAFGVTIGASNAAGETVALVDAGGNPVTSVTPDGSGNATAYVKVTAGGNAVNATTNTVTVTDANGVVGSVPIAIAATTSLTIGLPAQTGASVYYNVSGYPNTGSAIALAGSPAVPYILAGNASSNVALSLTGNPGSVTATNAGAVGSYGNMLTSDGTNVYFAQYSSNNAYRQYINTVFVLASGSPLTLAGCDAISAAQGYFWCEGSGFYNTFDDQLSQFGTAWAPQGNNPNYLGYYTNSTSTPVLKVMTSGPNGVFFGSSPTTLYSLTNIASRTTTTYTPLSFPQVGSFNGLATNANGDLFVADSTNKKVWKISAPVGVASTVTALSGPGGSWLNPGGVAYDAASKILWVVEGDATGSSLGRVVKATGY